MATEVITSQADIELRDLSFPNFAPDSSPLRTLVDDGPPDTEQQEDSTPSNFRRYSLLVLFCVALFMDAFNGSALFAAIPTLIRRLGFSTGESVWIVSAYQLAFAAFLLIVSVFVLCLTLHNCHEHTSSLTTLLGVKSGRISDLFTPSKYVQIFL